MPRLPRSESLIALFPPSRRRYTLQLPARSLTLGERTLLMGILNVTPDSFSEQGRYFDRQAAVARGLEIEREGADLLDIGGESTRPGATPVDAQEEMDRVLPVIEALRRKGLCIPISIDTYKAAVAGRALAAGAEIVNDVSGLRYDKRMGAVVREHRAGVVLMHLRGTPRTMQTLPRVQRIIPAIQRGLLAAVERARKAGIARRRIILDPGIGFGKDASQNYEILRELPRLARLGFPLLVGPSRKSFLEKTASNLVGGAFERRKEELLTLLTAVAGVAAILHGAHLVRVHDVREMAAAARVADRILR